MVPPNRDPIAGGFPTRSITTLEFDGESKFREVHADIRSVNDLDRENLQYAASQDEYPTIAPFLAASIAKNRSRRNYYIDSRGKTVYYDPRNPPPPQPGSGRLYDVPTSRDSFGSSSLPGMAGYSNLGSGRMR